MGDTLEAYDLGATASEIRNPAAGAPRTTANVRTGSARAPTRRGTGVRGRAADAGPGLYGTLSLIVPGSGQLLRGETMRGLFYLSTLGFLATLGWSIFETFDRLVATLSLLGSPIAAIFWTLGTGYAIAAALHLTCVLNAAAPEAGQVPVDCHPAVSGFASALIPGWGQLLNGDRARAGLFLGAIWIIAATWIVTSQPMLELLNTFVPAVGSLEQTLRQPFVLWTAHWTAPILVWSLAVYDAVASAISRR